MFRDHMQYRREHGMDAIRAEIVDKGLDHTSFPHALELQHVHPVQDHYAYDDVSVYICVPRPPATSPHGRHARRTGDRSCG